MSRNPWIGFHKSSSAMRLRLICFHCAGYGASLYRPWLDAIPDSIDIVGIQLPGREARIAEDAFESIDAILDAMQPAIAPLLQAPYAFFGHSMGALLAFALTQRLCIGQRLPGQRLPVHLFLSGHQAPRLPPRMPPVHDLSDEDFIEALKRYNGTPPELLASRDAMELFLPMLRADLKACEIYDWPDDTPVSSPITALGGLLDPEVPPEDLDPWAEYTSSCFDVRLFDGDHFYLKQPHLRMQLIAVLLQVLATQYA
jgi:medium-chain acyl-[acyl-carrier-protein] hydrolase